MDFFLLTWFGLFETGGDIQHSLDNTFNKLPSIMLRGFGYMPIMKFVLHRYIPLDFQNLWMNTYCFV